MTLRSSVRRLISSNLTLLLAAGLLASACGNDTGSPPEPGDPVGGDDATDFISHLPGESSVGRGVDASSEGTADGAGPIAAPETPSAERAISEADILKLEGDTLYALSRYSGMTIVDLSDPSNLRVLGTYRSTATPFEMYLEGGTAYIMFNDFASSEWDAELGYYVYRSTSRLEAVDVSNPAAPKLLGHEDMPGEISDSRKVGDIVYVVTHQSTYCWGCDAVANTRISSFDVSDPELFNPVDEQKFVTEDESWGRRSVSVSTERMYVSGYSWNSTGQPQTGTIQVVDISDPAGAIEPGATLPIGGMIESRWQMDEYEGVLRVISQPGGWGTLTEPLVETFSITSASEITPLGSLSMVLPRPEDLQSVRFDGERAFAVTFERTDPLFTLDLSDPAVPRQLGELEIPGWLYHMEPRGDRLYALGFDPGVDNGALHVSIFDVSNLEAPSMLDRVNFGGDWGWFDEDQDRIHKLFNLALDQELILLPYSGSGYEEASCSYYYGSGIQLIDVRGDDLTLRGVAPQVGTARRAVLHDSVLFGISDNAVQAFDITDRDNPSALDRLDVARNVSQIKVMQDRLLRFGENWWTGDVELDLVDFAEAEQAESTAALDLSALENIREQSCTDGSYYSGSSFTGQVFTHGSFAFLPRSRYESGSNPDGSWFSRETMLIEIVDTSGSAPRVVGEIEIEPTHYDQSEYVYYAGFAQTERALLIGRRTGSYDYNAETGTGAEPTFSYDVIDLRDGADARVVTRFDVPLPLTSGGWGYGVGGCMLDVGWGFYGYGYSAGLTLASGNVIASQHEEEVDDGTGRVRYYLDRVDLSDPENPSFLDPINIPGQLLRYDDAGRRVVTLDYEPELVEGVTNSTACYDLGYGATYQYDPKALEDNDYDTTLTPGSCVRWQRRLHSLVLEDGVARRVSLLRLDVGEGQARRVSQQVAVTDSHIFYQLFSYGQDGWQLVDPELVALGYASDGRLLELDRMRPELPDPYASLVARDHRAFLSGNGIMEVVTSKPGEPLASTQHKLRSWSCWGALEVTDDQALCAMGMNGVQSIPLD